MADRYEDLVFTLVAENPFEQNGQPEAMKKRLVYLSSLSIDCQRINKLKSEREFEFSPNFLAWVETELKSKFTYHTLDQNALTIYNVVGLFRQKSVEPVFYNVVYCVLERYGFHYRHKCRKCILSFDAFCTLTGNDRKTLSRIDTIKYTKKNIPEIWLRDKDTFLPANKEKWELLQEIIIRIAKEIEEKSNEF